MVHKILGWFSGYVTVRVRNGGLERFVNLCRHHGIQLWQVYWNSSRTELYAKVKLSDYYRLRPVVRKTKVFPVVVERHGAPFILGEMRKRYSFFVGIVLFFGLLIFLSSRVWGIAVEGESYHTKESILKFLDTQDVYGGMAVRKVQCAKIEEMIRRKYEDIGWASVEKKGSMLYVRLQEVQLVKGEKQEKPAHLIAAESGKVVSIVTSRGTAKVRAGARVKKGDILISGVVRIIGDNQELLGKDYVHAEGTVVIQSQKKYQKKLKEKYQKKSYTGDEKRVYQCNIGNRQFFFYNPLNHLETFEKYDIIRDGGQICPSVSLRFPAGFWKKTFREVKLKPAKYSKKEASEVLNRQREEYLNKQEAKGYQVLSSRSKVEKSGDTYVLNDLIIWSREQDQYRRIYKKSKMFEKKEKKDGTAWQ